MCPVSPRAAGATLSGRSFGFSGWSLAGWRFKAGAPRAPTLAEFLALLGSHFLPTLVHALVYSSPYVGTIIIMTTQAAEQNAAESQQSESLPEGDLAPPE